jgi:enediyne biosynthesis protein E3
VVRTAEEETLRLREKLIIPPSSLDFPSRGYRPGRPEVRTVLGAHSQAFLGGYNAVVVAPDPVAALRRLRLPVTERGFAVEGGAMAAVLLDLMTLSRGRRTRELLASEGDRYRHLVHIGAGFAMGKLRWRGWVGLAVLDPLLRWLAFDGWGFAVGALGDDAQMRELARHRRACGVRCAIRHQGVGRAIWFIESTEAERVAGRIRTFPRHHHGDLWSGIGFAATLAGGGGQNDLDRIPELAGEYRPHLMQGVAFAAEVSERSGQEPESAQPVVKALTDVEPAEAAGWSVRARVGLERPGARAEDHQLWRSRIRDEAIRSATH